MSATWPVLVTVNWYVLPGAAEEGLSATPTPCARTTNEPSVEPETSDRLVEVAIHMERYDSRRGPRARRQGQGDVPEVARSGGNNQARRSECGGDASGQVGRQVERILGAARVGHPDGEDGRRALARLGLAGRERHDHPVRLGIRRHDRVSGEDQVALHRAHGAGVGRRHHVKP